MEKIFRIHIAFVRFLKDLYPAYINSSYKSIKIIGDSKIIGKDLNRHSLKMIFKSSKSM